jgi:hypothetical protein
MVFFLDRLCKDSDWGKGGGLRVFVMGFEAKSGLGYRGYLRRLGSLAWWRHTRSRVTSATRGR